MCRHEVEERLRRFYDSELKKRRSRPLGEEREGRLASFIETCEAEARRRVIEVGCGAGRDGREIAAAGLDYTGVDVSSTGVEICRELGLDAHEASAVKLPFHDNSYDAGWSMSTLMHLVDADMELALAELRRVIVAGGILEIGVWGSIDGGVWIDPHGRYFRQRTDEDLQALLGKVGDVIAFDTWHWFADGGHYQWARLRVSRCRSRT